ncbi:TPA: hypothetical protein N0F65_006872 [Lagenidium giganteum]|uniref:Conserved oligomeric Golgi complex subunit 6 n=1 Tax=Lagenidium giganteum TaxID=4803 RepID=A0AAV2ZGJ9_9STRA|nr:TPA: hypothetical protein N0F65_006872 [Lagenidium giganteum]
MTTTSPNAAALYARVHKLLGSRAEVESTKALLNTLVANRVLSTTDASGSDAAQGMPLSELRKTLRTTLEEKQLKLAESVLQCLGETLDRIGVLKGNVEDLDRKCTSIQNYLDKTKRESEQVQAEAQTLSKKKETVQVELEEVKQFLSRYQLAEEEIAVLYNRSLGDGEMYTFFNVMERVQQIKADCKEVLSTGEVNCGLELLDTIGKYQEVGFERLYQWTTKKCAEVEGEPSTELHRAIALLRDRPEFYNYCKECITSSRRSLIVRRFIIALTRGGPNGIPRPIEMHAHDPVRYCGDMLAWVHQAIATENEFFRVLFDGDTEFEPSASNDLLASDQATAETSQARPNGEEGGEATELCTSMVGRAFEGVARPLQVRIEQTLASQHGIVIAYKLVHLLAFYHHTFDHLVKHSGVAIALATSREASSRAFHHQFQMLVDQVASSAQDYSTNLTATHATMDASHRLVTLLEVFQSSLLPEAEKEADLTPLFDGLLPAVRLMCDRSVQSLNAIDALVFRINNLSCVRVPLARFPEVQRWCDSMNHEITTWLEEMSEMQANELLERCDVTSLLQKIREHGDSMAPASQVPGLDGETISSVMEDFFSALMALVSPQADHLVQPDHREKARHLTASKLASAYTLIYDFVHDPKHGYKTKHQTTAALGGNQAILLHTPKEVRTVLELETQAKHQNALLSASNTHSTAQPACCGTHTAPCCVIRCCCSSVTAREVAMALSPTRGGGMSSFQSHLRSQSSVQLMGAIDSYIQAHGAEESADEGELRVRGHETLVNSCTSVLSCIQLLRRIIRQYAYGRMGRELQHLSLTVASFERVLYTFIKEEIIIASKKSSNKPPIDFRSKTALKDIIPLIPTDERYTILSGGVASLLRHATKSLDETRQVLQELQSSYDPHWEKRWSLSSTIMLCVSFFLYKRFSKRTSFKQFLFQVLPSRQTIKWGVVLLVVVDYWKRVHYRFSNLRRIKVHHSRVLMALRLFLLCQHVLQRTRPLSNGSDHRLLIDAPMESDIDDDLKNATTLLVERVPLPAEYYDRSSEPLGFTVFKIGTNVLLASSAFAHSVLGMKNKRLLRLFGPPLVVLAIPYYAIRHAKASRYTTRILIDHANVDVIRMGWRIFGESRLVKFITGLQCPKVAVLEERFVQTNSASSSPKRRNPTDIGIRIFSARPLASVQAGTWDGATTPLTPEMVKCGLPTKRPVLFYIHGGGFFGRFIAKDYYNLTAWACKLGAVIVYVDYGLAPETQYPDSLNECIAVYKWMLNGGLGFAPDRISIFGESAGGNLAAALCVQCIQEHIRPPDGAVLMFPALNMHLSPSPSRFLHQSDPVLPRGILELALNSYYPSHGHSNQYKYNIHDPRVSPGLTEDGLLQHFPPTSLVVGDMDLLLDDSVDFYTRLSYLQVPASLKIYPGLSHGFLIYGDLVPEAQKAIDDTCNRVQQCFLLH